MPDDQQQENLEKLTAKLDEHPFGIITQLGYQNLEERIETWISRGLIAFSIIGLACALSLVGFGIVLSNQSDTTQKIQTQRYQVLLTNCLDQNERHNNVVQRIDDAVSVIPPPERERAEEKSKPFRLILDAAVPYRDDCPGYAHRRLKGRG